MLTMRNGAFLIREARRLSSGDGGAARATPAARDVDQDDPAAQIVGRHVVAGQGLVGL
jgi:hypothetical protein